jgi:DNA-directed RNA polymerase subunit F
MVIKEESPISMPEVFNSVGATEKGKQIKDFIKGFNSMKITDAKNLAEELGALKIMKLKDSSIVKIVDFLPSDASELNKVLSEISFDSEEVSKILDVVKKY